MQVKELSNLTGVRAHVIRYYTQIGLLSPTRDPRNRYRDYASTDVDRVLFIRRARWLGFTLSDIGSILKDSDRGISPCPEVRRLVEKRARQNRTRLEQFNLLQTRMERAIALWDTLPDGQLDHNSLCHLIESVAVTEADLEALD